MSTADAWARALERFRGGYDADERDMLEDEHLRGAFLQLLEEEVRAGMARALDELTVEEAERIWERG